MAYILHIDTSGDRGIVALSEDGKLLAERINTDTRNHAAVINLYIDELVKEQGITLSDLSAIAVCGGPGSYTGLRIGLSTAKALCYVLDIPLLHHDRLLLMALPCIYDTSSTYEQFAGILPAREKEYFLGIYDSKMVSVYGPQHTLTEELTNIFDKTGKNIVVAGKIADESDLASISKLKFVETDIIDLNSWSKYAYDSYVEKNFADLALAEPFYLKQVYTHK
ncbi:MAG: tRNA (adenosine(37)-N6)-threonylcarbamoyltransferase complex dimerization subunit type 1 TsaB [Sphingobacteriales bacterium]|nr:MAG: tRNA (adenosine(37)-N6)-threonylcarbamoyltransferase complex dimerization subunit type 1 TsaB [Sphingobacteriales bacterium]